MEHILAFLEKWLRPWDAARQAANDWQILYLDAYTPHLSKEVADLAWSRGYICAYHGGCTTGICQVNDTDLHSQVQALYVELETLSFLEQQQIDPGNIGRSRQQVMLYCKCCSLLGAKE